MDELNCSIREVQYVLGQVIFKINEATKMSIPTLRKNEALKILRNHSHSLLCGSDVVNEKRKLFLPLNNENIVAYQVNLGP